MKADLFTYFVYTLFLAVMVAIPSILVSKKREDEKYDRYVLVGILIISIYVFVVGLRYLVGTDYDVYLGWFKVLKSSGVFPVNNSDMGYVWLNQFLIWIDAPFPFLFVIISFIQIFFMYKALEKTPFLMSHYFFFFFTTLFVFASMNHMRQSMAYFIFFYSFSLYFDKKYVWMVVLLALAASLHKSVLMYVWVYPLLQFDWYKNRGVQLALIAVSSVIADKIFDFILKNVAVYADFLNYGYYVENIEMINEVTESFAVGAGLGKFLYLILDGCIVWYSIEMKDEFKKYNFTAFYNLYFTGAFLESVFASNYIFARTVDYMSYFRVFILSFLFYYLLNKEAEKLKNYFIVLLIILLQLAYYYRGIFNAAANCAPYQSIFSY